MATNDEIMKALEQVMDPELRRNIVELGMVRNLNIDGGKVAFTLALTMVGCPLRNQMAQNAEKVLKSLDGVDTVEVTFGTMTDEERQKLTGGMQQPLPKLAGFNRVGQMIAVMSGKGGVGKSSVTALLAVALRRKGFKVGILDADITGPSIPRLFGLERGKVSGGEMGMLPVATTTGIRAISINLFVEAEDTPVILRGPMISGTINQFWNEVIWGKLDYLLIDMPPGTSDASLTVIRNLPVSGVLLVTTPQELATMVVRKGVNMLKKLDVPVLGVVENMSFFTCPDCGKQHQIFGPGHADDIAERSGTSVWARLPIDPKITALGDQGKIEEASLPEMEEMAARVPAPVFAAGSPPVLAVG
jgi:ATP-binding protein involved in chromosome partitioning